MKKVLLFLIIFLFIGCVSATQDLNENIELNDTISDINISNVENDSFEEYNYSFSEINLSVKENNSIPVVVKGIDSLPFSISGLNQFTDDKLGKINVYIDDDKIFDDILSPFWQNSFNIQTYTVKNDAVNYLPIGSYNITFEFIFMNKTEKYLPQVYIENHELIFDFNQRIETDCRKNYSYKINLKLNIIKKIDPILIINDFNKTEINISYSDFIPIEINSLGSGNLNIFLNNEIFRTYSFDEGSVFKEISTLNNTVNYWYFTEYLNYGTYNITFEFILNDQYSKFQSDVYKINSTYNFEFRQIEKTDYPYDYIFRFNTLLNIKEIFNQTILINSSDIDSINIYQEDNIPIIVNSGSCELKVYVDDIEIFENYIPDGEVTYYIKSLTSKNSNTYIPIGIHNIVFEFKYTKSHSRYSSDVSILDSRYYFQFIDDEESDFLYNYKYLFNTTLNVSQKPNYIPIQIINNELTSLTIKHADKIPIIIENGTDGLLKVFIDDIEVYEAILSDYEELSIDTYISSYTVFKENILDIKEGSHKLTFDFYFNEEYRKLTPEVSLINSTLYFKFNENSLEDDFDNYLFKFGLDLDIIHKNNTIHIINLENTTFEYHTSIFLKFDDIKEGFTDIGMIITDNSGVVYKFDEVCLVKNGLEVVFIEAYTFNDIIVINLNPGVYNIIIINFEDGTNTSSSFSISKLNISYSEVFFVDMFDVTFLMSVNYFIQFNKDKFIITMDNITKKVPLKFNGTSEYSIELIFNDVIPGIHYISVFYQGDEYYNTINFTIKFNVYKEDINISEFHEINEDTIDFYISTNMKVYHNKVVVKIGDIVKEIYLDEKSNKVSFNKLYSGNYEANIIFDGDERYLPMTIKVPFEILKNIEAPHDYDTNLKEVVDNTTHSGGDGVDNSTFLLNNQSNNKYASNFSLNQYESIFDIAKENIISDGIGKAPNDFSQLSTKSHEISKKSNSKSINQNISLPFIIILIIVLGLASIIYIKSKNDYDEY